MTLIAGIISRKRDRPLPASVCNSLRGSVSRGEDDKITIHADEFSFLAKLDIGAFHEAGEFIDTDGNVTFVTGEPLIGDTGRAV